MERSLTPESMTAARFCLRQFKIRVIDLASIDEIRKTEKKNRLIESVLFKVFLNEMAIKDVKKALFKLAKSEHVYFKNIHSLTTAIECGAKRLVSLQQEGWLIKSNVSLERELPDGTKLFCSPPLLLMNPSENRKMVMDIRTEFIPKDAAADNYNMRFYAYCDESITDYGFMILKSEPDAPKAGAVMLGFSVEPDMIPLRDFEVDTLMLVNSIDGAERFGYFPRNTEVGGIHLCSRCPVRDICRT